MKQIRIIAILLLVWNSACGAGNIDKAFLLSRIEQMFPNENKTYETYFIHKHVVCKCCTMLWADNCHRR